MILAIFIFPARALPGVWFRAPTSDRLALYCILGICAGVYLFVRGFRLLQRRRLILDTPVSKIRSASLGMVELSGLAVGPYTISAPITNRSCYFFRTLAWEWKRQGRSSKWVKVAAESMQVPFFVDDNTGKLLVDPRGAELDLHCDFKEEFCDSLFTIREEAPGNVRDFLARHGVCTTNKIKVEEYCIKPKNALFLLGTLDENPGIEVTNEPVLDDEENTLVGRARLALAAGVGGGDVFSGLSLTGGLQHDPAYDQIYEQALSTASARAIKHPPVQALARPTDTMQPAIAAMLRKAGVSDPAAPRDEFEAHPCVVLMKGKNNSTFLISWRSQVEIARALGWKCALMIWGGPALALLCLYALINLKHLL
jgi:E3 Ubiquitin ligase